MTILEDALKRNATDNLRQIAEEENIKLKEVFKTVSKGSFAKSLCLRWVFGPQRSVGGTQ